MNQKTITIEGIEGPITIKKLTHGERTDIQDLSMDVQLIGEKPQMIIKTGKMQVWFTAFGLVDAPFLPSNWKGCSHNEKYELARGLDYNLGLKLYQEITSFNQPDVSEKK